MHETQELILANKELAYQNQEKEKRAAELLLANKELAFQNAEKEKRAAELILANKELLYQNEEKEKRAAELVIANNELAYQNEEKEKRAAELVIANRELAYQNEEKEKRAAELLIANKELAYQNEEKEKRAAELALANQELILQNEEREKRATLIIANKELKKAEFDTRKLNEELEARVVKRTAELETANKELEAFTYSVSHDLRAPIRAIHGFLQMLQDQHGPELNTEATRKMNVIMGNAKKMGQLIDDLLAFSRLGRKELIKINVPVKEMVENICFELEAELDTASIEFHINDLPRAVADSISLRQVWINLISNAVKYSSKKEKSIIEIGSEVKQDEIIYYVKDNGAGFDMRYSNKLFGVFQRLHSEIEFEGTGVGLAIVHRIITKHGGSVWAQGKVEEGATFYFSLPVNTSI